MADVNIKTKKVKKMTPVEVEVERVHLTLTRNEAQFLTDLLGKCNGSVRENFYSALHEAGFSSSGEMNGISTIQTINTGWNTFNKGGAWDD